ncbi:MAG: hypothetical protein ABWZ02_06230 [Nakamurella sp.]
MPLLIDIVTYQGADEMGVLPPNGLPALTMTKVSSAKSSAGPARRQRPAR